MKDPRVTTLRVFNSSDFIGKTCKVEIDYCDKKEYKFVRFPDMEMVKCSLSSESEQEKIIPELTKSYISNLINKNKLPKHTEITISNLEIRELLNKIKKQ